MQEKGLITIESAEEFNDGTEKESIKFSANVEKMEEELNGVKELLKKARQQAKLRGKETEEER